MQSRRGLSIFALPILLSLALIMPACQTFNISVLIPTEPVQVESMRAATLPAEWTPTPIPEYLRPLESLTPLAPEDYTQGPDWDTPQIETLMPEGIFELGEFINFGKVVGDWLIVGDNAGILTIMGLIDPTNPAPLANIYLGDEERILSTEPGDPFSQAAPFIAAEVRDVEYEDGWLYVITLHRLLLFDVNDPYEPIYLGQYHLPPRLSDLVVNDIYVRVLVSDGSGNYSRVIEIDTQYPDVMHIEFDSPLPDTTAGRAHMEGDLGFVTKRTLESAEHLKLYALEQLGNPVKLGEAYGAPAFRAWVQDDYAFISTARVESDSLGEYYSAAASIWVVDITDPEDPESFSYIWTPDVATGFYLTDSYAYVIGGNLQSAFGEMGNTYWLVTADMNDPEYPIVFRTLDLPGQGLHITGTRGITYVAAGQAGLQILRPEEGQALRVLKGRDFEAWKTSLIPTLPQSRTVATPLPTLTLGGSPTPTATFSPTYLDLFIDEHVDFTVYWKRDLWEAAVAGVLATEDFERDKSDYGELHFPYLTGHGFILDGESGAQIFFSDVLFPGGNHLSFRDWESGLNFQFPDEVDIRAFGFDYKSNEEWVLAFTGAAFPIPKGRQGFVGVVMHDQNLQDFTLSCSSHVQGGLAIDNISYMPARLIFPSAISTATAKANLFATPTPTPGSFED